MTVPPALNSRLALSPSTKLGAGFVEGLSPILYALTKGVSEVIVSPCRLRVRRNFAAAVGSMKPGRSKPYSPLTGTIEGAPNIQTPSRAEHGPEGVFIFKREY